MIGIYRILNTKNGKCYIGSSRNILKRWYEHSYNLKKGTHHCAALQAAWNKYGEASFSFDVLVNCNSEDLAAFEQRRIDTEIIERSRKNLYNSLTKANSPTPQHREKLRLSMKGRILSDETRGKLRKAALEKTPAMRAKLSAAATGRVMSIESRQKMSASAKARFESADEETRRKIYANRSGDTGWKHAEETLAKMRARKFSKETREKMSRSAKIREAEKKRRKNMEQAG